MYEIPEDVREEISNDLALVQDLETLRIAEIPPYPTTDRIRSKVIAKLKGEEPFLTMEPDWYLEIDPASWPAKVEQLSKTYVAEDHSVEAITHIFKRIACRLRDVLESQMKSDNAYHDLVVVAGATVETDWGTSKTAYTYGVRTKYNKKGVPHYKEVVSPKDAGKLHKQLEAL